MQVLKLSFPDPELYKEAPKYLSFAGIFQDPFPLCVGVWPQMLCLQMLALIPVYFSSPSY